MMFQPEFLEAFGPPTPPKVYDTPPFVVDAPRWSRRLQRLAGLALHREDEHGCSARNAAAQRAAAQPASTVKCKPASARFSPPS
jgi:hypothetical protein